MNKIFLTSVFLYAGGCIFAQNLDLRSMSQLRQEGLRASGQLNARDASILRQLDIDAHDIKALRKASDPKLRNMASQAETFPATQLAFVSISDGHTRSELEKAGMNVLAEFGSIAIVELPKSEIETLASIPAVKAMSLQRRVKTHLDKARSEQGVDMIHFNHPDGGLNQAYTGRNVITGIVDQGFDPHHINFLFNDYSSRFGYLAWLRYNNAGTGIAEDHYNYTNISDFFTDNDYAYHGTHTLGIMSGSYDGPVTLAKPWDNPSVPETPTMVEENCSYYGVAPAADIAVSCGDLQDGFIAYGLEYLLNYSQWEDRPLPMVVNLSLGSNSGAHDPNTMMNKVLDYIGENAIVCVSAGNEGDLKIALNKTFTEEETSVKTMIYPYLLQRTDDDPSSQTVRYGSVEIWSDSSTPFKLKAVIYNKKRDYRAAYNMPVVGDNIGTYYVSSGDYMLTSSDIVGDPTFCKAYEGYVGVGSKLDEETGRYYGMVDFYVMNNPESNPDDDYVLGFEVVGEPGQRIDCYGDSSTTWMDSYGVEGFTDGSMNGSISDMAVAHNIIVVGSYNTRNEWTCLDGGTNGYPGESFIPGKVSSFSSFGTLADGRNLPTVCAPGSTIISSVSWPYAQWLTDDEITHSCSARLDRNGRVDLWKQEVGTSMASPFVAGSIALWLEADPTLKVNDVKDIIEKTSTRDDEVANGDPVRWGAGKFNALAGLKEVIRRADVKKVVEKGHNDRLILSASDHGFEIFLGEAESLDICIFSLDGILINRISCTGDSTVVDSSSLKPGMYILNVNGLHSRKIAVK